MKNLVLLTLVFITFFECQAQTKIKFNYDAAGNQIARYICINCNDRVARDSISTTSSTVTNDTNALQSKISYYPNPVQEELNIQWLKDNNASVTGIEVFSMAGQSLGNYNGLESVQSTTVGFGTYPQGFYNLTIYFSDGNKETLKVVKK